MENEFQGISNKGAIEWTESKHGYCKLCGDPLSVSKEPRPYGDAVYHEEEIYCKNCD